MSCKGDSGPYSGRPTKLPPRIGAKGEGNPIRNCAGSPLGIQDTGLTSLAQDTVDAVFRLLFTLLRLLPLQVGLIFFAFAEFTPQDAADGTHWGREKKGAQPNELCGSPECVPKNSQRGLCHLWPNSAVCLLLQHLLSPVHPVLEASSPEEYAPPN